MKAAIIAFFALVAVVAGEPGVLLSAPAVAVAPAPVHVPVAVPVATSSAYKIRAPAAKVLTTPILAAPAPAHHVPVATSSAYKIRAPAAKILTAGPVLAPAPVLLH